SAAPLALPTIAALTPEDIEVSITDENIEPVDFYKPVDLVGVTCSTWLAPRAYEIADEFRRRGVTVVLGGIHPSMLPHEAIAHADAVVIGE
ncbi:B12-binding domain-containing radical SAM protein, partial [bacterium]|nr:B12-binding domain-containing radical SAM protein [bacterium]NIO73850.1 B12-binding domain-containing radical SAM protein [bacterium]